MSQKVQTPVRVVAITGAARGIGAATAAAFSAAGARVAIGDIDQALAEQTAGRLGGGAIACSLDVTDRASVDRFVEDVEQRLGPIDVFVNNAGIMPIGPFLAETDAVTERQVEINLLGVLYGVKAMLPRMVGRGSGHLVNVASAAGKIPIPGGATYAATKHAVVGVTESLRTEYRRSGVKFHVVMPAIVNTELTSGIKPARGMHNVEPEDVAAAIVEAVQVGRFEVYVPRQVGRLVRVGYLMPRGFADLLGRMMGSEKMMLNIDESARASYRRRTGERPAGPPAGRTEASAEQLEAAR